MGAISYGWALLEDAMTDPVACRPNPWLLLADSCHPKNDVRFRPEADMGADQ